MITSVVAGVLPRRLRNAGTPFEIASTPVTAAPPDANACSTMYTRGAHEEAGAVLGPTAPCPLGGRSRLGRSPSDSLTHPDAEQHGHVEDEEVGGDGEELARLLVRREVAVRR